MATDDRDKPADVADSAGAAAGARDDLAAESTMPSDKAEGNADGGADAELGDADDYEP